MGCDLSGGAVALPEVVLTHASPDSAFCAHVRTTPWGLTGIPEDRTPRGEGWTGLTKPALSISALLMRLIAVAENAKSCLRNSVAVGGG